MDFEKARFNMVEQQIRTWDVLDQGVLDLLFLVRREDFVPPEYRLLAFADLEIPLGDHQKMWAPKMEARVLQELAIEQGESVLEIGTGSGYLTALLARHGARVTSVEINPRLAAEAKAKLARAGLGSVEVAVGDGARGWGNATYDAIVLTGSTPVLPDAFIGQLALGGRIFAVVGEPPVMLARLMRLVAPGALAKRILFETVVDPLTNAATPARFEF
ncbi:MAG TPA: protein-L-isoaspartate O-methyltransferase [Casimicrobiaceae bacterium]|nr:protein-L-isoaspartate O-methyltransferase [Casimicrobiaceae bacterium]